MIERTPRALLPLANKIESAETEPKSGLLVVVEGVDGSGKTTFCDNLCAKLASNGITATVFRNFIEGPFWSSTMKSKAQMVEATESWPKDLDRGIQILAFLAHVRTELPILLQQYDIVLADRYTLAKLVSCRIAYDGNIGSAERLLELAVDIPQPDVTFFLRIDPNIANTRIEERLKSGGRARDWRENINYLEKACLWYDRLSAQFPGHSFVCLDARDNPGFICEAALQEILAKIAKSSPALSDTPSISAS